MSSFAGALGGVKAAGADDDASRVTLYRLPGFLGLAQFWPELNLELRVPFSGQAQAKVDCQVVDLDYFQAQSRWDLSSLQGLAEQVNQKALENLSKENLPRKHPHFRVLLGYSFGGRVALHALASAPPLLWSAAILISVHPGLEQEEVRAARLRDDQRWAKQLRTLPWDQFLGVWDQQATLVDSGVHAPVRREADFCKARLAEALTACSLGCQEDFRPFLAQAGKPPLLWLVGEQDLKFKKILESLLKGHTNLQGFAISQAGHRIPWERSEEWKKIIALFLEKIIHGSAT